jgi:phospholipid/cholesterol/gamma-HCH transport system substrate-binding protein
MRNRSGIQGVASSPIIVGAVTVLVVIVAVFLAYNANNGLPFVSTYNLKAQVPNADALVKGNEIRIGGARVGVVREVKPIELPAEECGVNTTSQELGAGCFAAELSLSLDKSAEPLPVDTTLMIRPKSPLGLKYVQLAPGDSSQSFEAGDTIKISAARPEPIDIDEFFSMFDEKTRLAIQRSQAGFGNALAGRGPQINNAFAALRRVVEKAQPALRTIVAPETNFGGFWRALEDFSATLAPVAETQASMFVALDRTFAAFARVSRPYIQETISKSPPFLESATADLPALRPFLDDSARFFAALRPGTKALAETSPTIASALQTGVPVLNASPKFNAQLEPTVDALLAFQSAPGVLTGLDLLIDFNNTLNPAIKFIAPAQTVCNYLTLTFRNLADAFSETNGVANWVGATSFEAPTGPNSEAGPAAAPANGPEVKNHLHYNPYPNTASPGQTEECEAGNEPYKAGKTVIGNSPGNQGTTTAGQLKEGNG